MRYIGDIVQSRKVEESTRDKKMLGFESNNEIEMALPEKIRSYTYTLAIYNDAIQLMREFQFENKQNTKDKAMPVSHAPQLD